MNEKLRQELCEMRDKDQAMRKSKTWDDSIDKKHTKRLKEIVSQYSWPNEDLTGKDGSQAAWLIIQHADHDVEFQEECLGLMKEIRNVSKRNIAYLADRILVNKGELQIFGTQFHKNMDGKMVPRPIKDIDNLEARRKEYELEPFEEYKKAIYRISKEFNV